jgi:hypothetical protein
MRSQLRQPSSRHRSTPDDRFDQKVSACWCRRNPDSEPYVRTLRP